MRFGLDEKVVKQIISTFSLFPEIDEVILYGSRAKGNFREGSDIDLTIKGNNLSLTTINKISLCLDDLMLPYIFDISIYRQINNPDLIDHIKRVGVIFYKKVNEPLKEV